MEGRSALASVTFLLCFIVFRKEHRIVCSDNV